MSTRVLVIDDEESVAVTLAGILQQAGYQTDQAANLDEAVALIESKPFDAILLDLHLGGDDGLAVLDRVWATSPDTVAIVLTGYGTLESASRAMRLGVSEYLFKPCPVDELKSALRRGLDRRAAILATRQAVADERARLLAAEGQARREAEEARARAEAAWRQLHDLFMQAPAAIALTRGPDHVFELVNPIFLRMVGRGQPSDLLGKPAAEALPEIVEQGFVALADRVYTSGQPFAAREVPGRVARRADGALDEGYFDVVLQPYRDLHGQVAGIVQFDLDVTKQVRARQRAEQLAEQLVAERAQLARALERFQATFEQAAVGIAHVALDGRWLLVNEKMCAILGYPRAELLAGTFQDVTHPDDLEADLGLVARLLAGEIPNYCLEKRY
jgi:ActR/RegA family two-component response regulator